MKKNTRGDKKRPRSNEDGHGQVIGLKWERNNQSTAERDKWVGQQERKLKNREPTTWTETESAAVRPLKKKEHANQLSTDDDDSAETMQQGFEWDGLNTKEWAKGS